MTTPPPRLLTWPPAETRSLSGSEVDLWWIDPEILAAVPRRSRSQALLRTVLACYLPADAGLQFDREAQGRPFLRNPGAPDFNLSDTRGGSVIAVSAGGRIGVDLERADRRPPAHALAQRWFAADEAAALGTLDEAAAARGFMWLWTAKEAACKATGTGIFGWLEHWRFDRDADQPRLLSLPAEAGSADDWSFLRVQPSEGYTCVLAARGFTLRLRDLLVLR